MDSNLSITQNCAAFINKLEYEQLEEATIRMTKRCIIDWMGCVIGGSSTEAGEIVIEYINEVGNKNSSTIFGTSIKTDVLNGAMANGCLCHILEMDDVHKGSIMHIAAPVISAAFSVAEDLKCTSKDLITAIICGYDVAIRIGEAVSPSHYRIWHTTGTCGVFGAAAATAKLLKLKEDQIVNSLGNAGSQAAGLWEFAEDNAMSKYLHCGKAAMNGTIASLLAKRDFTGAKRILEGRRGFFIGYCTEDDWNEHFDDLGQSFKINETVFKPYASCRHTHSSVDAVLKLKHKYKVNYSDVKKIIIETYENALHIAGNKHFRNAVMAKFSLVYCVAAALKYGKLGVREFQRDNLDDIDIKRLVEKIEVYTPKEISDQHPEKWMSIITIKTEKDEFREVVDYPKGDPENPLTEDEINDKFYELATLKVTGDMAKSLLERCANIEQLDNIDDF